MSFFGIPDGMAELLKNFTLAVMRERPTDLYNFAADYFAKERDVRNGRKYPMYVIVDDDEAGEPEPEVVLKSSKQQRFTRRRSVAAERYNPEDSDSEEDRVVHPKTDEQREKLKDAVKDILLFKSLDRCQMEELIDAMFERTVTTGEEVIRQGDDGDYFYVIENGVYDVSTACTNGQKKHVHRFEGHGSFGELALMYNQPRSATIISAREGILWVMDRKCFRTIVLKSAFKKRKMYESILSQVPILKHLDDYERMNLSDALITRLFCDGDVIIQEGDVADGVYFVESGNAMVTVTLNGIESEVSTLTKGHYFGELALIENQPRSATVYAIGDVSVAFLERESFERLLGPCIGIMKRSSETYTRHD